MKIQIKVTMGQAEYAQQKKRVDDLVKHDGFLLTETDTAAFILYGTVENEYVTAHRLSYALTYFNG